MMFQCSDWTWLWVAGAALALKSHSTTWIVGGVLLMSLICFHFHSPHYYCLLCSFIYCLFYIFHVYFKKRYTFNNIVVQEVENSNMATCTCAQQIDKYE